MDVTNALVKNTICSCGQGRDSCKWQSQSVAVAAMDVIVAGGAASQTLEHGYLKLAPLPGDPIMGQSILVC